MKFYIKATNRTSALGITTSDNTQMMLNGEAITISKSEVKRFNGAKQHYSLQIDQNTKNYIIFAKEPIINPFYGKPEAITASQWLTEKEAVSKMEKISEQMFYEIKHNRPRDFYSPIPLQLKYKIIYANDPSQRSYLDLFRFSLLCNSLNILDTNNIEDELVYLIFKNSQNVEDSKFAMSKEDLRKFPNAEFYIYDELLENTEIIKNKKIRISAMSALEKVINKFNNEQKYKLGVLIDSFTNTNISSDGMETKLFDYVENTKSEKDLTKFIELVTGFSEKNKVDDINIQYYIKEAQNRNIIKLTPEGYIWNSQVNTSAHNPAKNLQNLFTFFKEVTNKEYLDILKDELKSKNSVV